MKMLTLRVDDQFYERVKNQAWRSRQSMTAYMRAAIFEALKQKPKPPRHAVKREAPQ